MRFGKIEYLNLLPFDVFVKKYPLPAYFKMFLNLKKSYPSKLNMDFLHRRIDAGFISSIAGYDCVRKKQTTIAGIVAKGAVWSVLVLPNEQKDDYQSASSNALAKVLGIKGEVLIGDKALIYKLSGGAAIDLGEKWWDIHHLGFSFGRLCFNRYARFYKHLACSFVKTSVKIPYYILCERSRQSGVSQKDILAYLKHIHYRIGKKENIAISRFYAKVRLNRIKKPMRF